MNENEINLLKRFLAELCCGYGNNDNRLCKDHCPLRVDGKCSIVDAITKEDASEAIKLLIKLVNEL